MTTGVRAKRLSPIQTAPSTKPSPLSVHHFPCLYHEPLAVPVNGKWIKHGERSMVKGKRLLFVEVKIEEVAGNFVWVLVD